MKRYFLISFLVVIITSCGLVAQANNPPYMLVRVDLSPQIDIIPLLKLGVDIVDGVKGRYVEVVCHPHELAQIRFLGYQTEVKIADMERYYAENSGTTDDMGGFHTWSEAIDEINQVHIDHPGITTDPFTIGQTGGLALLGRRAAAHGPSRAQTAPSAAAHGQSGLRARDGPEPLRTPGHPAPLHIRRVPGPTRGVPSRSIPRRVR